MLVIPAICMPRMLPPTNLTDLPSVHRSHPCRLHCQNIHAEAIQTVHGGEHTQIEAGASYGISPLCGDVFP